MQIFKAHQTIDTLAPYLPDNPIIVEAGAFIGNDTVKMAKRWPHATIHAFEPVPEIFARLQENTKEYKNIILYNKALSDTNGFASLYIAEKHEKPGIPTQAGSLHAPKERLALSAIHFPRTITVPTITLDAWAQQHAITHIDMLWLDLQGHELAVLKHATTLLITTKLVLTEVAFVEAYEQQPTVSNVFSWAEKAGFECVGRDFVDYHQWFFGNLLFLKKD